mgnify:CR=1 FL=1
MTTELTKAAQQAPKIKELVEQLRNIANGVRICGVDDRRFVAGRLDEIADALTQRPAAQAGEDGACGVMPLIEDYAKAVHDGDDALCQVLRRTIEASLPTQPAAQATPKADPLNPGWCVGCNPDNCIGCGIGLNEAQATPEPVGEVVYQIKGEAFECPHAWRDATEEAFYTTPAADRRILYTRPASGVPVVFTLVPVTPGQVIDWANKALPGWSRKDNDLAYIEVVRAVESHHAAALAAAQVRGVPDGFALLLERAQRLVEFADFKLGGTLSAESDLREIPSKAGSWVKTRHLAALRDSVRALSEAGDSGLYFVQDTRSFVGNCPLWWKPNGGGYTTNLDEAGKFTREAAMKLHQNRDTDLPWLCSDINRLRRATIDAQYLPRSNEEQAEALAKGEA